MAYYKDLNPFSLLTFEDNLNIQIFLHQYHNFPLDAELNMETVIPYLDKVFDKVSSHVVYYADKLRQYKSLAEY